MAMSHIAKDTASVYFLRSLVLINLLKSCFKGVGKLLGISRATMIGNRALKMILFHSFSYENLTCKGSCIISVIGNFLTYSFALDKCSLFSILTILGMTH